MPAHSLAAQALHDLALAERPAVARPKAAAGRTRRP